MINPNDYQQRKAFFEELASLNNFDSSFNAVTAYSIIKMIEFATSQKEWDLLGQLAKNYAQELREAIILEYPNSEPFLRPTLDLNSAYTAYIYEFTPLDRN